MDNDLSNASEGPIEVIFKGDTAGHRDVLSGGESCGHDKECEEERHQGAERHHDGEGANGNDLGNEQSGEADGDGDDGPKDGLPEFTKSFSAGGGW